MGSCDVAVCRYSRSDSICLSPGVYLWFRNKQKTTSHHDRASSMLYSFYYARGNCSFTNSLPYRPSYITERFRTLIRQSKKLYSTALLSSLCAPWPTEASWYCLVSSTVVSWQQFYLTGELQRGFSSQWMRTYFFTILVKLCSDVWSSQPSVKQAGDSDEIVLCIGKTAHIYKTVNTI